MKNDYSSGLKAGNWPKVLSVFLGALLLAAVAIALAQHGQLARANARMDAVVQKAFYETCELTEGMSVNFAKLPVAGEPGYMQTLLNEIARQTQGTLSNLALLPLGEGNVSATIKFINQAGDFATGLSGKLANGGAITASDHENIILLSRQAAEFSNGMGRLLERYESGEAVFTGDDYQPSGGETLYPITNPAAEYPTLLYDGPFSDGKKDGEFRFLKGLNPVTQDQAKSALARFLDLNTESGISFVRESSIPVECYEFTVQDGEYLLEAGVTKAGGEMLYILSDYNVTEMNITPERAADMAEDFLEDRYGDMEMSYASMYDGIITINFAAEDDDIILYPDLVKVQLSLKDGKVIGLEAENYLMNHARRSFEKPALSPEEAITRMGSALTPRSVRLALIPENSGEYLCYEINATDGNNVFLVYIDASSGVERKVLQVVSDAHGSLVM